MTTVQEFNEIIKTVFEISDNVSSTIIKKQKTTGFQQKIIKTKKKN